MKTKKRKYSILTKWIVALRLEIVNCKIPPKELMEKLIGKPLSQCEKIIKDFLKPKEKLVVKFLRKIGFKTSNDNQ